MSELMTVLGENIRFHHTVDQNPRPDDFKMHTHEDCELCYFISGKGVFYVEGSRYPLKNGDILIMNKNESHYIEIDPRFPYARFAIHFKKNLVNDFNKTNPLLDPFENRAPGHNNLYRSDLFGSDSYLFFLENMVKPSPDQELQIITNLLPLLNEISIAFKKLTTNSLGDDEAVIRRIIKYISDNLNTPLSLDTLCAEFYISKSQLCRVFKKSTGSTVWNYITVKRLMLAKSLIDSGEAPTVIYAKCGFSDYSVFFKAFKKHFGYTPGNI